MGMGMRCGPMLPAGPPLPGTLGPGPVGRFPTFSRRFSTLTDVFPLVVQNTKLRLSSGSTFPFLIHINCRHYKHPHSTRRGTHGLAFYLQERPCGGHATSHAHALVYRHTTIFYVYMDPSVMIKTTESLNPPASVA